MRIAAFMVAFSLAAPAYAHPDGAPWGAADPEAEETCSSCHFDNEPIWDSSSVDVFFGYRKVAPGEPTELYVQFNNPENKKTGIQIIASAGKFTSKWDDIETIGVQARSISPRDNSSAGDDITFNVVMWTFLWTPPETFEGDIYFLVAINESNDDQSSFGDKIHYYTYTIPNYSYKNKKPDAFWKIPEQ